MRDLNKVVWVALCGVTSLIVMAGCNDEKKPPLTPDGPEMTSPVGGDGGADMPAAPGSAPTAPTPPK